jgi:YggT family protein
MQSAFVFFDSVVTLIIWAVILSAILSWLVGFNIINVRNRLVYIIVDSLQRITEPLLLPIRRFLPNLGGIDLSPIVLILLLIFFRNLVFEYLYF